MTLYELKGDMLALLEMAEGDDVDDQAISDTWEALEGEFEDKAEGYAKVIAQLNADADSLKKEIDRLTDRKKSIENRAKLLKNNLQSAMELTGKTKFKTRLFSFGIQSNPAKVVLDVAVAELPHEFLKPADPEADKKALSEYLKSNGSDNFPFAHLEQSQSLRIR